MRELDERLGFGELIQQHLTNLPGANTRWLLADLYSQQEINACRDEREIHQQRWGAQPDGTP